MAAPILLEPIDFLEIIVPNIYTDKITRNLASRRAIISTTEATSTFHTIMVQAPSSWIDDYSTVFSTITLGQGTLFRSLSHYAPVPNYLFQQLMT